MSSYEAKLQKPKPETNHTLLNKNHRRVHIEPNFKNLYCWMFSECSATPQLRIQIVSANKAETWVVYKTEYDAKRRGRTFQQKNK